MYGFESWTFETQQCRDQLHAGIIKLYKKLICCSHSAHMSDEEVLVATDLPSPTELLRGCRLRYFGTLHNCGRDAQWGLLAQDATWIAMIEDDFKWLWQQLHHSTSLPDPTTHYPAWQDLISHHGGYWKKLIKRGLAHACLQRANRAVAKQLHQRVAQTLHAHGWIHDLPLPAKHLPESAMQTFGCLHCQTSHASKAGESAHMFKRHGFQASARGLFDGTSCPHCFREYHTRAKVLAHLRPSHQCRQHLIGRKFTCQHMPGTGSTTDVALHSQTDGAIPFLQGQGPRLPEGPLDDFVAHDIAKLEALFLCLIDLQDGADVFETLRSELQSSPVSWTVGRATLAAFLDTFTQQDADCLTVTFAQVTEAIKSLMEPETWPFLKRCTPVESLQSISLEAWEDWFADHAVEPQHAWEQIPALPRALSRYKIVLHAYAGRRCRGDIEWFMDALAIQYPGCVIMTASVDIVIDSVMGDISRTATRDYWLHHITCGHVVAFIAGPPCNTWSRARNLQLDGAVGPRLVRTVDAPWGLPSLRLGELRQVLIGSLLLGFAFECMAALATCSGSGLLEHPKDPEQPDLVSIWRLPILQVLLTFPRMRLLSFAQGLFGAPSPKPTSFLVLGLDTLETDLHSGRLTPHLPTGASIGKDHTGNYKTAPLKEYPPALCRAVAVCMCKDLASTECGTQDPPADFITQCKALVDDQFDGYIGHDG